jgi:hypothetical protein
MNQNNHAALWSASPSSQENRYRITHHNRTKRVVTGNSNSGAKRNGHGMMYWTARVATHGRRSWWERITFHGNRWRQLGEQRQPERGAGDMREHGWQGSPRGSPKNFLAGAHRNYGEAR